MPTIEVNISASQQTKLRKGEPIQLSYNSLMGQSKSHIAEIDVDEKTLKAIQNAVKNKKGVRVDGSLISGGSIKKAFKKASRGVTKTVNNKGFQRKMRDIGYNALDKGVEVGVKKAVPIIIDAGIQSMAGSGFGVRKAIKNKVKKGSNEAREKMARLRSMKSQAEEYYSDAESEFEGGRIGRSFRRISRKAKSVGKSVAKTVKKEVNDKGNQKIAAKIGTRVGKKSISVGLPVVGATLGAAAGTFLAGGPGVGSAVGGVAGRQAGMAGANAINKKIDGGSVKYRINHIENRINKTSLPPRKINQAVDSVGGNFLRKQHGDYTISGRGFLPIGGNGFNPI